MVTLMHLNQTVNQQNEPTIGSHIKNNIINVYAWDSDMYMVTVFHPIVI